MLRDFQRLKIRTVVQLAKADPLKLYNRLSKITGHRQDPCVLDTFRAAVAQARDPKLPRKKRQWWYWSRLRIAKGVVFPKTFLILFFALGSFQQALAQKEEMPNFSLMFHAGGNYSTGFIPSSSPGPEAGAWMGISISDRFEGLWGLDYYTMPDMTMQVDQSNISGPLKPITIQPTADMSFSVNLRWYLADKWDYIHHRFDAVPYLFGGLSMDALIDKYYPPTDPTPRPDLFSRGYDLLFGMNLGVGMDFPMDNGQDWALYAEGLDHLILWQGLTQVIDAHVGIRFMLDAAHVDPFR